MLHKMAMPNLILYCSAQTGFARSRHKNPLAEQWGRQTLNPDPACRVAFGGGCSGTAAGREGGGEVRDWRRRHITCRPARHITPPPVFQRKLITTSAPAGSWRRTGSASAPACHAVGGAWRPHSAHDQSGAKHRHGSLYICDIIDFDDKINII